MDSVIKHTIAVGLGKIKTNNKGKELKSIVINDKTYRYDKDKPLSQALKNTLSKIEKSNKYRASKIFNQASDKNKVRSAIKQYAIKQKATITEEQSAFKTYVISYSISNINMKGWRGLSYLKYQEERLKQFLDKNSGMKVLIQFDFKIITPAGDQDDDGVGGQVIKFRSRRFEVLNTGDISVTLTKMAGGIQTQIGNSYLNSSGITLDTTDKITIRYDKCNPTRAGSYIDLPKCG